MHPLLLSLCAAAALVAPHAPQDAATAAWNAATALRQRGDPRGAAELFESFPANFPDSPRKLEALVEAGVCRFSAGRNLQKLHRNTPEAVEQFDKALALFERVTADKPADPLASRAQYMKGSTHLFEGELEKAESDYGAVLERFGADPKYVGKALERRATVRRQRLDVAGALADLTKWQTELKTPPEVADDVKRFLEVLKLCGKPAPPLRPEQWLQGQPTPLEAQKGKVVLLYFFASWCPNCATELPFVLDLHKRFAARGVTFVGCSNHNKEQTTEQMQTYLQTANIPFPVMIDNGLASSLYKASTIPYVALIDRAGRLRWCDNSANLTDWTLERLLSEK